MLTVLEIIRRTTEFLATRGVESPRLSAEHLVGHALGLGRMRLYLEFERPLTEPELARIRPLVKRRSLREPLQHILGCRCCFFIPFVRIDTGKINGKLVQCFCQ